jgi:hypothetical protein
MVLMTKPGVGACPKIGLRAAALVVCGLAIWAAPAWAQGAWYPLGTGQSPVNHTKSADAEWPSLASDNGNVNTGALYLAWQEAAAIQNSGTVDQVRVADLAQDPFEPHPWSELLTAGRFSLNLDPAHSARQAHVAVLQGVPYVAWIEDGGSSRQIHVAKWDGSSWVAVDGSTPINGAAPAQLTLSTEGGTLFIGWTEICCGGAGPGYTMHVDSYDGGTTWTPVGGVLNYSGSGAARDPDLADIQGYLVAAWSEDGAIRVSEYDRFSSTWNLLGSAASPISTSGESARRPSLADIGGHPGVAWDEVVAGPPTIDQVRVAAYQPNTSSWSAVGSGPLNSAADASAYAPSLADIRATPYIAWLEKPAGADAFLLHTSKFDGSNWQSLGPPLNQDPSRSARSPDLIDTYTYSDSGPGFVDTPVLAWSETDSQGHDQIRAAAYGEAPQNTFPPHVNGIPKGGNTLTCTHGTWTGQPTSFTVVWDRGLHSATSPDDSSWHAIDGASGDTYTVTSADYGSRVRCRVIASGQIVSGEAVSQSLRADAGKPFDHAADGQPFITGKPVRGQVLTCHPGTISTGPGVRGWHNNPDFTYQWLRNGQPIPGATFPTHRVTLYRGTDGTVVNPSGDGDHLIGCRVTGSNDVGSSGEVPATPVHAVDRRPVNYSLPEIQVTRDSPSDSDPLKETLDCSAGRWYDDYGEFQFQWLRNGAPIAGQTTTSYRPTFDDYGRKIACQVTDGNPAGRSQPAVSDPVLIKLPPGLNDINFHREGGNNAVDPTSLLAITGRYEGALRQEVIRKLKDGIATTTEKCRGEIRDQGWPTSTPDPTTLHNPLTEEERCRILVYDPSRVVPSVADGVRYHLHRHCFKGPSCPSLSIEVTPIDPLAPPREPTGLLQDVAASTPVKILWDIDHNGTTDASCPASAPVLRSILAHGNWHPRVVIMDEDGTLHTGDLRFPLGAHPISGGRLRPSQVRVCATSFDPPPKPQLPCVTGGEIGSIHITDANLCPISARDLQDADFEQLLNGDLKQYLLRVSEQQLRNEGASTSGVRQPGGGLARPIWVGWDGPPTPGTASDVYSGSANVRVGSLTVSRRVLAAGLADSVATLTSENSPFHFPALKLSSSLLSPNADAKHVDWLKFLYKPDNAPFAYNQIYVARGTGAVSGQAADVGHAPGGSLAAAIPSFGGDLGSMVVNGVEMSSLPDVTGPTAELLVPSDVNPALPNVNSMTLVGRNVASSLGLPTDPQAVALSLGGELHQQFDDATNAAEGQVIQTANVDALLGQANDLANQGKALAKQNLDALVADIKKELDLGPFDLAGNVTVKADKDGSATIHASAELPGLTGLDGKNLRVEVTINADLQGHLRLAGIHMTAGEAFLFGIDLRGLDLTYDGNGLDVKGEMLFPQLANAGVKINDFKLGPNGSIRRLDVSYEAGAGQGIPLGYGLFLTALGALVDLQSSTFGAHATFSVGPSVGGGCPPVGMDTTLDVHMAHPFSMDGYGKAIVACVKIGDAHFHADEGGSISLTAHAGLDLGPIGVDGDIGAAFQCTKDCQGIPLYQVWMDATGHIDPIITHAGVHVVLSNQGLAGCGEINVDIPIVGSVLKVITGKRTIHLAAGAAENFTDSRPPVSFPELIANLSLFTGCDIGRYYVLPHSGAIDAAAGSSTFRIAAGSGPILLSLEGAGRAPRVSLRTPSGRVLDFTGATHEGGKRLASGEWGIVLPTEDRTVVVLPKPQAGVWTAHVAQGSATIIRIRQAAILPPVAFRAQGTGHRSKRVLKYLIAPEKGQTVQFYEKARGENRLIKTIKRGGHGRIRYRAGQALSVHRQVLAEVFQNGQLRDHRIVAKYDAPSPGTGKVRKLRVRRRGSSAVITWSRAPLGNSYAVQVDYGTGERTVVRPRPGSRRVVVSHLKKGEGLVVMVVAYSMTGRAGPLATARLKGSLLVGATHKVPPFKPPHRKRGHHRHHHR